MRVKEWYYAWQKRRHERKIEELKKDGKRRIIPLKKNINTDKNFFKKRRYPKMTFRISSFGRKGSINN